MRAPWCTQCLCSPSGATASRWKFPSLCWIGSRRRSPWRPPPLWFGMPTFKPCWGPSKVSETQGDFMLHHKCAAGLKEVKPYLSVVQVTLWPKPQTSYRCCSRQLRKLQHRTPSMLCSRKAWRRLFSWVDWLCWRHKQVRLLFQLWLFVTYRASKRIWSDRGCFCPCRDQIHQLLESDLGWEEAVIHYREVPLPGQWRK